MGRISAVVTNRIVTRTEAAMASLKRILLNNGFLLVASAAAIAFAESAAADDAAMTKTLAIPFAGPAYNWNGFYAGLHIGGAFGTSNWSTPRASGSAPIYQTINTWDEAGSFLAGFQGGYNRLLPNRILIGGEVDATFPNFPNLAGLS